MRFFPGHGEPVESRSLDERIFSDCEEVQYPTIKIEGTKKEYEAMN
jgi:hypothetical protein